MKPQYLAIIVAALFIGIALAKSVYLGKSVYGDGIYYYSWLRSVVVDHDLSFNNDYRVLGGIQPRTPFGLIGNVYPIGPPLLWAPFFVHLHSLVRGDGFSSIYQYSMSIVSTLYALAGLCVLYRLLSKHTKAAGITTIAIAFGTNLLFYGAFDTVNSHSVSFFVSTILLTLLIEKRSLIAIGIFSGLLATIRTQDIIFVVLVMPRLTSVKKIVVFGVSLMVAFSPQLVAWRALYGTALRSPYLGPYHFFDFINPKLIETLISPNNGLWLWTPIIALCTLGLIQSKRYVFLLLVGMQWLLISSWSFWWQGASYSGRMFISLLPIFAFGLAHVLSTQKPLVRNSIVIGFSVLNTIAILYYLVSN